MSEQSRIALKASADAKVTTNGAFENTGERVNQLIKELIDSCYNIVNDKPRVALREHSATTAYDAGQCFVYQNVIYLCLVDQQGAFDATKVQALAGQASAVPGVVPWDNETTFEVNDLVSHEGLTYVVTAEATGQEPPNGAFYSVVTLASGFGQPLLQNMWLEEGDVVRHLNQLWEAKEAFLSDDFATELAANKWFPLTNVTPEGSFHYHIKSGNTQLNQAGNWREGIVGGKLVRQRYTTEWGGGDELI